MTRFIHEEKPSIYDRLHEVFGVEWDEGIIITYGDCVYCKYPIPPSKEVHEFVHVDQQLAYGVQKWWNRYITDPEFRLSQELEAYSTEVAWIKKNVKDRNEKFRMIRQICFDLSSPIYGRIISYKECHEKFLI